MLKAIQFFYTANTNALESNYKRAGLPADFLNGFNADTVNSVKLAKAEAEIYLSRQDKLYTNITEILDSFLTGTRSLYASLHIDDPEYTFMHRWDPYGMHTVYRYGIEKVLMQIWFTRYRSTGRYRHSSRGYREREYHIGNEHIKSFDFFGRLVWDEERKCIDAVPLFLTNIEIR